MPARFVPLTPGSAPIVLLQKPVLLIGRHPECDVRFDLPSISRRHCCLAVAYDRVTIRDLGSRHGIRINGEACEEARLHNGDEIAIGPLLFRFEDEPIPPKASPAKKSEPKKNAAAPANTVAPPSLPNMPRDGDELVPLSVSFSP